MNIYHHRLISATQKFVSIHALYDEGLKFIFEFGFALFDRLLILESGHEGFPEFAEK